MKRITVISILLLSMTLFGNTQQVSLDSILPVESGKIKYRDVVNVPETEARTLYNKAIEWLNIFFVNAREITKTRNPNDGIIEGETRIQLVDTVDGTVIKSKQVFYRFTFEFKENRFRYTITEFTVKGNSKFPLEQWIDTESPFYSESNRGYLMQIKTYMDDFISSFTSYMTKPDEEEDDDW